MPCKSNFRWESEVVLALVVPKEEKNGEKGDRGNKVGFSTLSSVFQSLHLKLFAAWPFASACDSPCLRGIQKELEPRGAGGMLAAAEPGSSSLQRPTADCSRLHREFVVSERRHRGPNRPRLIFTLAVLSCLVFCTRADNIRTFLASSVLFERKNAPFARAGAGRRGP